MNDCRIICGYCQREIGEEPLRAHFDSGKCGFVEATYYPFNFLALPLPDEPVVDWMSE